MFTYLLFLLAVTFPGLGYALIHRRFLRREYSYRLFPLFIFVLAAILFIIEIAAFKAGWWGIYPHRTLGLTIGGVPVEELLFFVLIPQVSLLVWALSRRPGSGRRAKYFSGHHWRQWRNR